MGKMKQRKLNLHKKASKKEIANYTKKLFTCPSITAHANTGGPFTAGQGKKVTVPLRMEVLLQALTRQLNFTDGQKAKEIFILPAGDRVTSIKQLVSGMDVVVTGGERMKQPIGNKDFFVTKERSALIDLSTWLKRHGLERRGLTTLSILKKVVFTHSCSARGGHTYLNPNPNPKP